MVNQLFLWAIFNSYFDITRGYWMFHDVSIVVEKDRNFSFLMRKPICLLMSACWLCVCCFIHRTGRFPTSMI